MAKKKNEDTQSSEDNLLSISDLMNDDPKRKKEKKLKSKNEIKDDLADIIKNDINSPFKKEGFTVAYFLDGTDNTPADITDWVSTGNDVLDMMISNRRGGGLPVGRLVEYNGLEGTGKTLFCASTLAETQKKGGIPVFIDSESSISPDFMRALGINFEGSNKLIYVQLDTVEDAFATIDNIIRTVRENTDINKIVTIVLDSLAGLSTKVEMEDDFDQAGYATQKAIIISKAMRKLTNMIAREKILFIFTNQLRTRLNVSFGDPYCVDPYSTKVKISYEINFELDKCEELTLYELAERFLGINDFKTPAVYDMTNMKIKVLSKNLETGEDEYKSIKSFVVKQQVNKYYTDGKLKGTENHRIIDENNNEIFLKDHPEFNIINEKMDVVDIEVQDNANYYANGRLNHNTTSGGKAPAYHSSVRIRLKSIGYLKDTNKKTVGITVEAKVIKNRMGPPMKSCKFDIYFDSGIDNIGCIRDYLKEHGILKGTKAKFTYTDKDTNEKIEFSNAEFIKMMELPEFKEKMMKELELLIVDEYKPRDLTINDELTVSTETEEEE